MNRKGNQQLENNLYKTQAIEVVSLMLFCSQESAVCHQGGDIWPLGV